MQLCFSICGELGLAKHTTSQLLLVHTIVCHKDWLHLQHVTKVANMEELLKMAQK